jgi:Predicted carbamoyl transferase, NodU family
VDTTARIQLVTQETNPRYYKLINEFKKQTGVPILLNTSF